ncbi:hypothetical protein CK203_035773 [Vitis vinifera]|uniref:Uncharacterized protein n=1 Tax=Vitis vinifera TaxID=29760 RepID=A0A438FZ79_VITVI|nr:hypothetical protein CK203_035773 [Vitis vinifera]
MQGRSSFYKSDQFRSSLSCPKKAKKEAPPKPSVNKTQSPPKRVNKRKGVPSRAPFF